MISFFDLANEKDNEFYLSGKYSEDSAEQYRQAHIEAFLSLMDGNSFNPHEEDIEDRETILMRVAWTGRLDLVKVLVEAGADVNAVSLDGTFALGEAARMGWKEIYDYLAPLTNPELIYIAQQSIAEGFAYQKRLNNRNEQVEKLIDAVNEGNLEKVLNCIENYVDVNAIGFHYSNALHRACFYGHVPIINTLLSAGADPDIKEARRGKTPLMIAIDTIYYLSQNIDGKDTQLKIIKTILKAGANVNVQDNDDNSALSYAIEKTKKSALVFALVEAGANINSRNIDGTTPLMISCGGWAIPQECVETLLKAEANIELKDNQGNNALMYAIREPKYLEEKTLQLKKVKLLIEAGANINTQNNNGNSPLRIAREIGNTKIIELLLKAGAKEN